MNLEENSGSKVIWFGKKKKKKKKEMQTQTGLQREKGPNTGNP